MTTNNDNNVTDKRKNPTWLKAHQFKPGSSGRLKGTVGKAKRLLEFTRDVTNEALLINPETGKHFKDVKDAALYWAKKAGSDSRIAQKLLEYRLGKPEEKVAQTITFIGLSKKEHDIVQVEPVNNVYELPEPDSNDESST